MIFGSQYLTKQLKFGKKTTVFDTRTTVCINNATFTLDCVVSQECTRTYEIMWRLCVKSWSARKLWLKNRHLEGRRQISEFGLRHQRDLWRLWWTNYYPCDWKRRRAAPRFFFLHSCSDNCFATFLKILVPGHPRSGHQVRSRYPTSEKFQIASRPQWWREKFETFRIWCTTKYLQLVYLVFFAKHGVLVVLSMVLHLHLLHLLTAQAGSQRQLSHRAAGEVLSGSCILIRKGNEGERDKEMRVAAASDRFRRNSGANFNNMTVPPFTTTEPRFVGRSWNAQKKRQIPFDSWWCADSKNVFYIKIGRWPFSKIALLCLTRYLFL